MRHVPQITQILKRRMLLYYPDQIYCAAQSKTMVLAPTMEIYALPPQQMRGKGLFPKSNNGMQNEW